MQTIARGGRNMELSPVDSGSVMMTLYHFHVMLPPTPPHTPSEWLALAPFVMCVVIIIRIRPALSNIGMCPNELPLQYWHTLRARSPWRTVLVHITLRELPPLYVPAALSSTPIYIYIYNDIMHTNVQLQSVRYNYHRLACLTNLLRGNKQSDGNLYII